MFKRNSQKKKSKRDYNVFLHTHTVSGIVITVGLFVCFFAGAFAIFRSEINYWQYNAKAPSIYKNDIDYERIIAGAEKEGYNLNGRNFNIRLWEHAPENTIFLYARAAYEDTTQNVPIDTNRTKSFGLNLIHTIII